MVIRIGVECFLKCSLSSVEYLTDINVNNFYSSGFSQRCYWRTLNPFWPNVPFSYPLKTSENQTFSDVFRGSKNAALG